MRKALLVILPLLLVGCDGNQRDNWDTNELNTVVCYYPDKIITHTVGYYDWAYTESNVLKVADNGTVYRHINVSCMISGPSGRKKK